MLHAPKSQMDLLAKTLEARGVIERVFVSEKGQGKGKGSKLLFICVDALIRFNQNVERALEA